MLFSDKVDFPNVIILLMKHVRIKYLDVQNKPLKLFVDHSTSSFLIQARETES